MKKKLVYTACFFFLFSRIFFINTEPLFFDSAGYIKALSYPNLFDAIVAVHFPLHDGYIILFWPFYHAAAFVGADPILAVILGQISLALITVYFFYKCMEFLTDKKTAAIASGIISLTPLFWISNVTILYEISYVGLYFASLYLLISYIRRKREFFIHLSMLCLVLALFTHMMLMLWVPLYFAIVFFKSKKLLLKLLLLFTIYFAALAFLRIFFVMFASHNSFDYVVRHLYFGNYSNASSLLGFKSFLVSIRNFIIPLMRSFTSLVVLLSLVSVIVLFFKNKKYFLYALLWIGPAYVALQFWEAQLPGRYAIMAGFGLAFAVALLIRKHTWYTGLLFVYLLIVSIPALNLLRGEIPYVKLAEYSASLPKDSLLIESHFSRRQVQDFYKGKLLSINEPNISRQEIESEIAKYIKNKKPVFVSSAALTDPYGLYAGPYLHSLSLSYAKPPELKPVIEKYTLSKYKVLSADDGIVVYKIIAVKPHSYPNVKNLKDHYRRIDYNDPLWRVYRSGEQLIPDL